MVPDDFWSRKRREEEKEEREAEERADAEERRRKLAALKGRPAEVAEDSGAIPFDEQLRRATVLIDQLEHLYRQFAVGVLMRPPVEERSRLDQMMTHISHAPKASTTDRFRFSGVLQSYTTHKSRWDKLLADIESGKIKRVAGPKR
jgi:hypothetical protein